MITTPIENVLGPDRKFPDAYLIFSRSLPRPLVKAHKEVLGRQDRCVTGSEFRSWVWENDREGWRVHVSNKKGICFEVSTSLDAAGAWRAWTMYVRRFRQVRRHGDGCSRAQVEDRVMAGWRCTYKGHPYRKADGSTGHAAPGWSTFDCRVWENGHWRLALTRPTGGRYRVEAVCPGRTMSFEGTNWTALVRQAKEYAQDVDTWIDDRILEALESCPVLGLRLPDIVARVFSPDFRTSRLHTGEVGTRIEWLAKHGFVFTRGGAGAGTRWCVEAGQPGRMTDRDVPTAGWIDASRLFGCSEECLVPVQERIRR